MKNKRHEYTVHRYKVRPNVARHSLYSEAFDQKISIKASTTALKDMDRKGGLDNYLMKTPVWLLGGQHSVGAKLKEQLQAKLKGKHITVKATPSILRSFPPKSSVNHIPFRHEKIKFKNAKRISTKTPGTKLGRTYEHLTLEEIRLLKLKLRKFNMDDPYSNQHRYLEKETKKDTIQIREKEGLISVVVSK